MKKRLEEAGIVIIFFFLCVGARAQLSEQEQAVLEDARELFILRDYQMTWNTLEALAAIHVNSPEITYLMGASGLQLHEHRQEGYVYIKQAASLGYSPAFYPYARAALENMNFQDAKEYLDLAISYNAAGQKEITQLQSHLANAERAVSEPVAVALEPLGETINSGYIEHTPVISYNDSVLFFTSRRPLNASTVTDLQGEYDENIFRSVKTKEGWQMATALEGNVNDLLNDAAVGLQANGEQMIVFKTTRDLETSDLWLARNKGGQWELHHKLRDPVNSKWVESAAALAVNGDFYIVASDRPGGYGGMDLYRVTVMGNGDLSQPQNLGPSINTVFNETSPFLLPDDKTLFFSSDNTQSIGGYDIFKSVMLNDTTWAAPENLGYPLNSTRDDLHLTVSWKNARAYFTRSNPVKPGDFDIFTSNLPGFNMKANVWKIHLSGHVPADYHKLNILLFNPGNHQVAGVYSPTENGTFLLVLLPNQAGRLEITCEGYEKVVQPFEYHEYGEMKEFVMDIKMKSAEE